MAQNVTVAGASYSAVPSVSLPKTGGGTASFFDLSDTTAVAADVPKGKYFYLASGLRVQGTARPLKVEAGQFQPSSDIARPTINFSKTYSMRPFFVFIRDYDSGSSLATANSCLWWAIVNYYDLYGASKISSSTTQYARVQYSYKTSSSATAAGADITNSTASSSASDMGYYLTTSKCVPYLGSTSRYFRSNRYYDWIAVFSSSAT